MTPYLSPDKTHRALEIAELIQSDYERSLSTGKDSTWHYKSVQASLHVPHSGLAVVIVRGTEGPKTGWHVGADWVRNLRAVPWYDQYLGWTHSGYLKGARGLFKVCYNDILAVRHEMPVGFAGHSKGGAEASDLAAMFYGYFKPAFVVTFGASRPGRLAALEGLPFDRFIHGRDPVPYMPPWISHPKVSVEYSLPPVDDKIFAVQDHGITGYISSLRQHLVNHEELHGPI